MKLKYIKLIVVLLPMMIFFGSCNTSKLSSNSVNQIIYANKLAEKGKFEEAAKQYRIVLDDNPESYIVKRNLGIVLVKIGKYREALGLLRGVLPNYPRDSELYYFLGEASRAMELISDAQNAYEAALKISPTDQRVIKSYSWISLKNGDFDKAENLIKDFYIKDPFDLQLMLIKTSIDLKRGRYSTVINEMREFEQSNFNIVSRDKTSAETEKILLLNVLGVAYANLKKCDKAQKIYEVVLKIRPFLSSTLTESAKCDLVLKNEGIAKEKLEKAYASDQRYLEAIYLLGKLYAGNDQMRSIFYYKRFLELSLDKKDFAREQKQAESALAQLGVKNFSQQKKSN